MVVKWSFRSVAYVVKHPLLLSSRNPLQIQGIPVFRDFTIRDYRYFVILFEAKYHDFEEKNQKKKNFFQNFFFRKIFLDFLKNSFIVFCLYTVIVI